MKHCKSHAPPFGVLLVAMLALVAFIAVPAFADSAGPPGTSVVTNEQYVLAPPDTGQSFVIDNVVINPANILVPGATTANVESFTAFANVAAEPINRIAPGKTVAIIGIVVNDPSPPARPIAGLEDIVLSTPAAQTIKEVQGDAILHGFAGDFAIAPVPTARVEYDLLC